ncbi:hypothetical protein ACPV5G_20780, partial [Photobacterium damselae]|uniref:hypothetical protein n=1 Tax=Photobacterium damselae TaxID=38293 RepID=UPI004067DEA1
MSQFSAENAAVECQAAYRYMMLAKQYAQGAFDSVEQAREILTAIQLVDKEATKKLEEVIEISAHVDEVNQLVEENKDIALDAAKKAKASAKAAADSEAKVKADADRAENQANKAEQQAAIAKEHASTAILAKESALNSESVAKEQAAIATEQAKLASRYNQSAKEYAATATAQASISTQEAERSKAEAEKAIRIVNEFEETTSQITHSISELDARCDDLELKSNEHDNKLEELGYQQELSAQALLRKLDKTATAQAAKRLDLGEAFAEEERYIDASTVTHSHPRYTVMPSNPVATDLFGFADSLFIAFPYINRMVQIALKISLFDMDGHYAQLTICGQITRGRWSRSTKASYVGTLNIRELILDCDYQHRKYELIKIASELPIDSATIDYIYTDSDCADVMQSISMTGDESVFELSGRQIQMTPEKINSGLAREAEKLVGIDNQD